MAATKLTLYNGALQLVTQRKLAALTEEGEPRRLLDDVWSRGAVQFCLEQGLWNFAMRTVRIDFDPDFDPDYGFQRVFTKPDDWVRTASVASDEYFRNPLSDYLYKDESGYWYSDEEPLYIRYVSNSDTYGFDFGLWPKTFERFVEAYLAQEIYPRLKGEKPAYKAIQEIYRDRKLDASSKDAMNEGAGVPAIQSWVRGRLGNRSRRDRGNRGSLIG